MEVLVTGGNGYVGHHLVDALLARGDRVRVLVLPGEDVSSLVARDVDVHVGDVCRPETLTAPMRAVDGVVHLAAMMHVWRPLHEYRAVNVSGSEHVCRAAMAAGVHRVVHMSSSSVYGMTGPLPYVETSPLAPFPDPYPVSKAEGDHLVLRLAAEEGVPAVVLRPDQIFGPGDRLHFAATAARVQAGRGIVVGRGDNLVPLVYVTDVVDALLLALEHPAAVGEAFNVTATTPLTQQQFLDAIAAEMGAAPVRLRVPQGLLAAAAAIAERVPTGRLTWDRPPLTRLGVAFLGADVRCSGEKARARLGFVPRVSLSEGVRLTAAWVRDPEPVHAATVAHLATATAGGTS